MRKMITWQIKAICSRKIPIVMFLLLYVYALLNYLTNVFHFSGTDVTDMYMPMYLLVLSDDNLIGYISDEPDLTLVKNEDGVQGYVYTKEFNIDGDVATEEEAIRKAKDGREIIIIPMYLQDGKTVIGEFKIGS